MADHTLTFAFPADADRGAVQVLRAASAGSAPADGDFSTIATLGAGATTHEDAGAPAEAWYAVRGVNTAANPDVNGPLTKYRAPAAASSADADAAAHFAAAEAAGGTLTTNKKTAINDAVVAIKNAGLWTKVVGLWPHAGWSTAAAAAQSIKGPDSTPGALTYSPTGGFVGDDSGSIGLGISLNTGILPGELGWYTYLEAMGATGGDDRYLALNKGGDAILSCIRRDSKIIVASQDLGEIDVNNAGGFLASRITDGFFVVQHDGSATNQTSTSNYNDNTNTDDNARGAALRLLSQTDGARPVDATVSVTAVTKGLTQAEGVTLHGILNTLRNALVA